MKRFLTPFLLLCGVVACNAQPSPQELIQARLAQARSAVEQKDLEALGELISDRYRDGLGQDKRALCALVAEQFGRQRSIHLVLRVKRLALTGPGQADVSAVAALAGRSISERELLEGLQADFYRVDLVLAEENAGDWKVTSAHWRRVGPADFL